MNTQRLHEFCRVCGWRKGGRDSWNGRTCKCGHASLPLPDEYFVRSPSTVGDPPPCGVTLEIGPELSLVDGRETESADRVALMWIERERAQRRGCAGQATASTRDDARFAATGDQRGESLRRQAARPEDAT